MLGFILLAVVLVAAATVAWKWYRVLQPPARAPERWSESLRPDVVTVLIGANDAMATHDEASGRRYLKMSKLPRLPDLKRFEENLRELVRRLQELSKAKIGLMTLALIDECNTIIARVAEDLGVELLPLHDRLVALIAESPGAAQDSYLPGMRSTMRMVGAGVLHYILALSWNQIADRRGLALTVDLVHLNDRAGAVVGDLVERFALKEGV